MKRLRISFALLLLLAALPLPPRAAAAEKPKLAVLVVGMEDELLADVLAHLTGDELSDAGAAYEDVTRGAAAQALYFDAKGGAVSRDSQPVTYGSTLDSLPPDPARTGYTFGGWFTEAGGGGKQYTVDTVYATASSDTLYANTLSIPMDNKMVAYGEKLIDISILEEGSRTWTTSNSEVATAKGTLIFINGVGNATLQSFVSDGNSENRLEAILQLEVTPKPLTVKDTWVDTLKYYDGNDTAEAIAGLLEGVLPVDAGKVSVTATARYSNRDPGSGKPISVTYQLKGERAYCYSPPPNSGFSGTIVPYDGKDDGRHCDLWGMVVKQAEDSGAANRYAPWPGVSVAYTINGLPKGTLQTDTYGRYFLSELHRGDTVQLTAPILNRGYITSQQPKTVPIGQSLAKADTIFYVQDPLSPASLTLITGDGGMLKRWEREDIADTIFYRVPCATEQVEVSCAFSPDVTRNFTVTSTSIKDGMPVRPEESGDDAPLVEVGSLFRTTVSVVSSNINIRSDSKRSKYMTKNERHQN